MRVRWTKPALRDLGVLTAYVATDRPSVASRIHSRITATAFGLTDFPHLGRPGKVPDTRELVVPGLPWLIVYRIVGSDIHILRVIHGARQWPDVIEDTLS